MKKICLSHWNDTNKALELFVLLMDDMLFHFTHDSNQSPALNFHFLCIEIWSAIQLIERGILKEGNITPLYEEFIVTLEKDIICNKLGFCTKNLFINIHEEIDKTLNKQRNNNFIKALEKDKKVQIKYLKRATDFLVEYFGKYKYYNYLKEELEHYLFKEEALPSKEKKEVIYCLTKSIAAELLNIGYSQEFIFSLLNSVFIDNKNKKSSIVLFKDFFKKLSFDKKKYTVKISGVVNDFSKFMKDSSEEFYEEKNELCFKTEQLDYYTAYLEAEQVVNFYASVYRLSNHDAEINYEGICIFEGTNKMDTRKYPKPILRINRLDDRNFMIKGTSPKISSHLNYISSVFSAISLHNIALESKETSNQLLNMWTCLEILIEGKYNEGVNRINQIANVLTSVLNTKYAKSVFECYYNDIMNCLSKQDINQLNIDKDEKKYISIANLIFDFDNSRKVDFKALIEKNPLLLFRYEKLCKEFENSEQIIKTLNQHRKRLEWHIMRIYRTRNMIIHDAKSLPYLNMIIRNLHYYVDSILEIVLNYIEDFEYTNETFFKIRHDELKYYKLLEEDITTLNIDCLFFGKDLS